MVKVTGGDLGIEPEGEPNEPEAESEWGLGGGLTRILRGGVSIPSGNCGRRPRSLWDKHLGGTMMEEQTQITKGRETNKGKEVQDQMITMSKQGHGSAGSIDYNVIALVFRSKPGTLHLGCACM